MTAPPDSEVGSIARPDAQELFEQLLGEGRSIRVRVTGRSMVPALRGGEVLTIEPAQASSLRIGDIVFIRHPVLGPAIHRLVRIRRGPDGTRLLQTKGDGLLSLDAPVEPAQILGKVAGLDSPLCRLCGRARARLGVLRAYARAFLRKTGGVR